MRLFISYARADRPFAKSLTAKLDSAGIQTWIDYRDIPPGANWDQAVEDALRDCNAMLLILTPRSVQSNNVHDEWHYFLDLDKPIYPVLREACEIPFRLRRRQYVDFTADDAAALERLLVVLGINAQSNQVAGALPLHLHPAFTFTTSFERLPFEPETVLIPTGPFTFGGGKDQQRTTLPDYRIGKYPVTVGEYRTFLEAGGYHTQEFWTAAGWITCKVIGWTTPEGWNDPMQAGSDRLPVVGVSWYEAEAYCRWLAKKTERPYHLPSELEWEKAARGTDGRLYPWGNEWRTSKCNTSEAGIGHATPVGQFSPAGDSPYGLADMTGNVWEWCNTPWHEPHMHDTSEIEQEAQPRVIRGGSWNDNLRSARTTFSYWSYLDSRYSLLGFRVACAVSDSTDR